MLPVERLKFPIEPLVKQMLDQLPAEVWTSKKITFLDPAMAGGQFLVEIERRLRAAGHSDKNISERVWGCETNIVRVNYARNNKKLVAKNLFVSNFLDYNWGTMKFDVILGNPPYQDKTGNEGSTNSADLYAKFVDKSFELTKKYVMLVIPSAWSGPKDSKLKKTIFEDHQPVRFDTHGKKWFPVEMNTCWFLSEKDRQGPTLLTDAHGNCVTSVLNRHSVVTTNILDMAVIELIRSHAANSNLGCRWLRGKLHLNDVRAFKTGKVPFVMAVGTKTGPLEIENIPEDKETTGLGLHKLAIPNVSSSDAIGNIKYADPSMVGGHSVVFLTAKNKAEAQKLQQYLETPLVRYLVKSIKISTPNSKNLFELIPDMPKKWSTNQDLYKIFGLETQHIEKIEKFFG